VNQEHAGSGPGAGSERGGFRLPREARITSGDEIRALLRGGKRRRTRHLDVFVSASPVSHARFGMVVPKLRGKHVGKGRRVRGAAVQRNRLKRRLREIVRTGILPALRNRDLALDVLVRARPEAYAASFAELRQELTGVVEAL
jgi:ribonuclease P protein component